MSSASVATDSLPQLMSFVQRKLRDASHAGPDRRNSRRDELIVPTTVQPINEDFCPIGTPFLAVTRNISTLGIGFVHCDEISEELVALHLHESGMTESSIVAEIVWSNTDGPFYDSGAKLITKLSYFPSH